MHVWWIDLRAGADADAVLSLDERARAGRFRLERDRVRWTRARHALRQILGRYLGLPPHALWFTAAERPLPRSDSSWSAAPAGAATAKPRLGNDPRLRFSVAHAGDRAALAVASAREVGIDLEPLEPDADVSPLLAAGCTRREAERVAALPVEQQVPAALRLWVAKEAYLKALGVGLYRDPRQAAVELLCDGGAVVADGAAPDEGGRWNVRFLDPGPGWVAALATAGAVAVRAFTWPERPDATP